MIELASICWELIVIFILVILAYVAWRLMNKDELGVFTSLALALIFLWTLTPVIVFIIIRTAAFMSVQLISYAFPELGFAYIFAMSLWEVPVILAIAIMLLVMYFRFKNNPTELPGNNKDNAIRKLNISNPV